MHNKDFDIDQLRDYLEGKFSEEESSVYRSRLDTDPAFKNEVQIHTAILAGIAQHFDRSLKQRLQKEEQKSFFNRKTVLFVMAASITAITILTLSFFGKPDSHELFQKYYKPYYNVVSDYRRGDEIKTDKYNESFQFYERGEYSDAVRQLASLLKENPTDKNLQFYLGLSYLATGKSDSASWYLQMVKVSDHKLSEPAAWYLGLSYLQSNDREKAMLTFSEIESAHSGYSQHAVAILEELE